MRTLEIFCGRRLRTAKPRIVRIRCTATFTPSEASIMKNTPFDRRSFCALLLGAAFVLVVAGAEERGTYSAEITHNDIHDFGVLLRADF